ncbi:MAG: PAS domain S-box protein, partial [Gemmatimonadaceae bacterium]|nr:PAS domain S-box protein [Gemmatimonadaceae bacterium]
MSDESLRSLTEMSDAGALIDPALLPSALASIVDIAADAVVVIDDEQRIRFFNRGAEQIFGWTAAEILGQPLDVLLPEPTRGVHRAHVQGFAQGGSQARRMADRRRISGRRRNGDEFPAEASIAHTQVGDRRLYAVVLRDATERYRIENQQRWLVQSSRVLANSIELWPSMSGVAHRTVPTLADWTIIELLAPAVARPAILIAHRDPARDDARELVSEALRAAREGISLATGRPTDPLPVVVARSGEPTLLGFEQLDEWRAGSFGTPGADRDAVDRLDAGSVLLLPLYGGGHPLGVMHLVRGRMRIPFSADDVALAERYAALAALTLDNARLYEDARTAIRDRDDLLAIVSHDLRNPVNAVSMLTGALLRDADIDAEQVPVRVEQLEALRGAARQANGLISDLQDVSRIETGRFRVDPMPVDPSELVHEAVELFAPIAGERGITVDAAVEPSLPRVLADRRRITQLLANFIANAIKFSPDGSPIVVRAERTTGVVRFSVIDEGPGVAPEDRPRLFERYFQATRMLRSGSGLGLFIAKGIADA